MSGVRLDVRGVTKYHGAAPAVRDVSLVAEAGSILALLGPSGAGKTTLLRMIAGFDRPDRGTIRVGDDLVSGPGVDVPAESRQIGFVFQQGALFPHLTARKNIAFGLRRLSTPERTARLSRVVELCALESLLDRYPHELSGGEQQRVALARALARNAGVVLLDEPLSSVDIRLRATIGAELRAILRATSTTAVFVTHDHADAFGIADLVAVMQDGRIEQVGTPRSVYASPISPFVARFVGHANFIPGKRTGHGVETEIGMFPGRGTEVPFHSPLVAMVRADELSPETDPEGTAAVEHVSFGGSTVSYTVRTASGLRLQCVVPSERDACLEVGSRVRLVTRPDCVRCFDGGLR
jgi:iron(III) transport system ATP-binding protein